MADTFQLEMTPEQVAKALQTLASPNNGVEKFTPTTENRSTGEVETSDIVFTYNYDGSRLMTLTITKRKSFKAKLASLDQIRARMVKMLSAA